MKACRNLRAAMILVGILAIFAVPGLAQEPAQDLTPDPSKKTCTPPELTFAWRGYDLVQLTAKADPEQTFVMTVRYLEPPQEKMRKEKSCREDPAKKDCWEPFEPIQIHPATADGGDPSCSGYPKGDGLSEGKEFCLHAIPDGATASFYMDRKALLQAGGLVSLKYRALEEEKDTVCQYRKAGPASPTVMVLEKHTLNFDVGSVFNIQGDGSWKTHGEAALAEDSRWRTWFQSGFSLRYSALDASEDDNGDADGDTGANPKAAADDGEQEEFNPLTQGGGLLETSVYVLVSPFKPLPRLGFVGGWGLSSVPGDAGSALHVRQRSYIGIRETFAAVNAGRKGDSLQNAQGYIQAAWADDALWDNVELEPATETTPAVFSNERGRFFFEGDIEIPRIGTEWLRFDLRFFASVPRSGDGPSDIRISALASIDPLQWFPGLKGK